MRNRILIAFACSAALCAVFGCQSRQEPRQESSRAAIYSVDKYDPARDPAADLTETVKLARQSGKRILLQVGGNWCGWCRALDKFVRETPSVAAALGDGYILMKVNMSEENRNEAFLGRFPKIKGYPHIFVLESDGTLLHSQETGELEEGKGYSKDAFLEFLSKWAPTS